jgi:predicted dehydrogenase
MKTLGIGVIGYGFMGKTHTFAHKVLPLHYDPMPVDCTMQVICEATEQLARQAAHAGGFARHTTQMEDVIADPAVDVVHICTPNSLHAPALRLAIAAGKHIYVDKPVTASLAQADELEQLLKAYKGVGQVALQCRFFPATLRAKQLIEQGFLGEVTHFRAAYLHSGSVDPAKPVNWKSTAAAGGGVIRDLGSHVVDLLWWLIGPFESVNCASRIWAQHRPSLDKPGTMMAIDVEDAALMTLLCPGGAIGHCQVSKIATGAEDELSFEIHGRYGAIRCNLMEPNYLEIYDARLADGDFGGQRGWQRLATVQKYPGIGGKFPNPKFAMGWIRSHVHSLYSFIMAVADGRAASPSLAEGLHMQRVLEAIRLSADTKATVPLPQR